MFICIDNINFYIEIYGKNNKKSIVLLHGFSENLTSFHSLLELKSNYKVILIDMLGHGLTNDNLKEYSFETLIILLEKLFKKLKIKPDILYGYSMGARIAYHYAYKYPKNINYLILESTSMGLKTEEEINRRRILDEKIIYCLNLGIEEFNNFWKEIDLFKTQKELPNKIKIEIEQRRLSQDTNKLIKVISGLSVVRQEYYLERLKNISSKIILIVGSLDFKYMKIMEKIKKELNCKLIKIENSGHNVHLEQASKIIKLINNLT